MNFDTSFRMFCSEYSNRIQLAALADELSVQTPKLCFLGFCETGGPLSPEMRYKFSIALRLIE